MAEGAGLGVREFGPEDREWADRLIAGHQASSRTARRGRLIDPLQLRGVVAERDGERLGLLTFQVHAGDLDIVTLHTAVPRSGAGTALLTRVEAVARESGCRRLLVTTTNDNLGALAFYQRFGFRLLELHVGAVDADRDLKPEIPQVNAENGIEIHDLIVLAKSL